jgi:DNA-binding transcriptional LysR family regulator
MSLSRLRTFIEVYRQKSISAAARNLNLTQPAVSQHIAGLEVAIGRRLFQRDNQGVTPTAAAEELVADIGDKLDAAEAALASARARSVEGAGVLQVIGHGDFVAEVVAPELLPLLEAGVRVRLQSGGHEMVQQMIIDGDCDLGFSAYASSDSRLHCEGLRTERVLAVAAPAVCQRIAGARKPLQALLKTPLLAYNRELPLVDPWLEKNKIVTPQIAPALIGQDLRTLRGLLCHGYGWTTLPEYLCREAIARGELAEITAPVASTFLTYYLIWTPVALRQPRVAHARQTILSRVRNPQQFPSSKST